MILHHAHADPPLTLVARLWQLRYTLLGIAARVRDAVASAVSLAAGEAIRDGLCSLLAGKDQSLRASKIKEYTDQDFGEADYEYEEDPWDDDDIELQVRPGITKENDYPPQRGTSSVRKGLGTQGCGTERRSFLYPAALLAGTCLSLVLGSNSVPALLGMIAVGCNLLVSLT